jgi:hypothetical protein
VLLCLANEMICGVLLSVDAAARRTIIVY